MDDQVAPELPLGGAKRARDLLEVSIDVLYPLVGVEKNGEHHKEKNDDHLSRNLEAEPQNDQGDHCNHRHGIERADVNIRGPIDDREAPHDHAKENTYDHGKDRGVEQNQKALFHIALQLSRSDKADEGTTNGRWIGEEYRVNPPAKVFPGEE